MAIDKTMKFLIWLICVVMGIAIIVMPADSAFLNETEIVDISNHTINGWTNNPQYLSVVPSTTGDIGLLCVIGDPEHCANWRFYGTVNLTSFNVTIPSSLKVKSSIEGVDYIICLLIGIFMCLLILTSLKFAEFLGRKKVT